MKRQGLAFVASVMVTVSAAACGGSPPPPSTGDPGGSADRITGNERIGWNQGAADSNELATFRYAAYVDNNRSELTDVSCGSPSGSTFSCSSRLPAMSAGTHTIELVSFLVDNGTIVESSRSGGLRVTLAGSTAGAGAGNASSLSSSTANRAAGAESSLTDITTRDGVALRIQVITEEVESPTALAFAPDGRVFIAERRGSIRTVNDGTLSLSSATLDDVKMTGAGDGGLMGLALDPEFDRTHLAYALYTVDGRDGGLRFRVARFREVNGAFGERAVLMDDLAAAVNGPTGAIGIGPDRMLYVAIDDGGDPSQAAAPSSYSGKILRINRDGTTPDNRPVYASDQGSPRGLDWQPRTKALWIADQKTGFAGELEMITTDATQTSRGIARARVPLAARVGATSVAFYEGDLLPSFQGDLLIAARASGQLLRLRFDRRDPTKVLSTERLITDAASLTLVAVGNDGAVYVGTDRAVMRLAPR